MPLHCKTRTAGSESSLSATQFALQRKSDPLARKQAKVFAYVIFCKALSSRRLGIETPLRKYLYGMLSSGHEASFEVQTA